MFLFLSPNCFFTRILFFDVCVLCVFIKLHITVTAQSDPVMCVCVLFVLFCFPPFTPRVTLNAARTVTALLGGDVEKASVCIS